MNFYAAILLGDREAELRSVCYLKGKLDDIFKDIYKTKIVIDRGGSNFTLRVIKASGFILFSLICLPIIQIFDNKKNFIWKILLSHHWKECPRQLLDWIQQHIKRIFQSKQKKISIIVCPLPHHADGYLAHWYMFTHGCLSQFAHNGCLDTKIHLADVYLHHLQDPSELPWLKVKPKRFSVCPFRVPFCLLSSKLLHSKINLVARSYGNSSRYEKLDSVLARAFGLSRQLTT